MPGWARRPGQPGTPAISRPTCGKWILWAYPSEEWSISDRIWLARFCQKCFKAASDPLTPRSWGNSDQSIPNTHAGWPTGGRRARFLVSNPAAGLLTRQDYQNSGWPGLGLANLNSGNPGVVRSWLLQDPHSAQGSLQGTLRSQLRPPNSPNRTRTLRRVPWREPCAACASYDAHTP